MCIYNIHFSDMLSFSLLHDYVHSTSSLCSNLEAQTLTTSGVAINSQTYYSTCCGVYAGWGWDDLSIDITHNKNVNAFQPVLEVYTWSTLSRFWKRHFEYTVMKLKSWNWNMAAQERTEGDWRLMSCACLTESRLFFFMQLNDLRKVGFSG